MIFCSPILLRDKLIRKILSLSMMTLLFFAHSSFGSSYRNIHGHWQGTIIFDSIKKFVEFDILDAPCKWQQPNETPYILVDSKSLTNIISSSSLPSGDIILSPFTLDGLRLNPTTWSETIIKGRVYAGNNNQPGSFKVVKKNAKMSLSYCYHKDSALFDNNVGFNAFVLFSLIVLNGDKEYCCSNGVFSACRMKSKCQFSSMDNNGMYDFNGYFQNNQCNGVVKRTHPEPPIIIGLFNLNLDSECKQQPW